MNRFHKIIFIFLLTLTILSVKTLAQSEDSVETEAPKQKYKDPRPRNAALMSMVLPGLGQAYNKKYWKLPILYAAIAADIYYLIDNRHQYRKYHYAYIDTTDKNPDTHIDPSLRYDPQQLLLQRDYSERNYTLNIILASAIYSLNIIDAYVDAHLKEFDVKDDLAIKIKPSIQMGYNNTIQTGLSIVLTFK